MDAGARILARALTGAVGQPVVVENRGGAGGVIGVDAVAKAPPDGYVLSFASTGAVAVNQSLIPNTPYDVRRDLTPIVIVSAIPMLIVVQPSLPVRDLAGFIALARQRPLTYGTSGPGGAPHLSGELLKQRAGFDMTHVPYRGAAPCVAGFLGEEVDACILDPLVLLPHVREGKARAVAVTSPARSAAMPEVPIVAEAGVAGVEVENWYALLAPAGTPSDRIDQLWEISRATLNRPEIARLFTDQGGRMVISGPADSAAFIRAEVEKWAEVVRLGGLRAD
ncbi:tripartite tricarboxylate transporter substrate binding protein [Roseomonas terrae]|uniref:Tripartite tricarboxylate transporter substrate binding protein n=1 Tax=Neoroseomonas terrae TaxID=424799 RepID=A0ABS5EIJ3_9PROT|nr:tripartite tricarboxylate transporter substrate binding protein [Neoroseomonas terrae]